MKDIVVFRVVVFGASDGEASVKAVAHGRPNASFAEDALMVLRGDTALKVVFGDQLTYVLDWLKNDKHRPPVVDEPKAGEEDLFEEES